MFSILPIALDDPLQPSANAMSPYVTTLPGGTLARILYTSLLTSLRCFLSAIWYDSFGISFLICSHLFYFLRLSFLNVFHHNNVLLMTDQFGLQIYSTNLEPR